MRTFLAFLALSSAWGFQQPATVVQDLTHKSQVLGGDRRYRVILPPSYATSKKRYPVFYWLYGYVQSNPDGKGPLGEFLTAHDVIAVSVGPVDTVGTYPLYLPELVQHIDETLRTVPDRAHRAISGYGTGGFMSLWVAGKYPDLFASASSLGGYPETPVGPEGFDVSFRNDEVPENYDGVLTLPEAKDLAEILAFHLRAFTDPPAKPAVFSHADVYPNFSVWGWEVASDRRQPGYTVLENVSAKGFRSAVRQWVPGGATIPEAALSIASPPKLYPPGSAQAVTYIRLSDGKVRRAKQRADAQGRLTFELRGEATEVGIGSEPILAASGYSVQGGEWATSGKPVTLRVKFWNKGGAPSGTAPIQWQSPDAGVKFAAPSARLFDLGPGESGSLPVSFTVSDPARTAVKIVAVNGTNRIPVEVRLFPPAEPATVFQIADGVTATIYQHGSQPAEMTFGEGNHDNHAAPGESFAILFPDGEYLRAAELFTDDACIDNTVRGSDTWSEYVTEHYSVLTVRADCQPGHIVHVLARVPVPKQGEHWWSIEFPVWYRAAAAAK